MWWLRVAPSNPCGFSLSSVTTAPGGQKASIRIRLFSRQSSICPHFNEHMAVDPVAVWNEERSWWQADTPCRRALSRRYDPTTAEECALSTANPSYNSAVNPEAGNCVEILAPPPLAIKVNFPSLRSQSLKSSASAFRQCGSQVLVTA